MSYSSIAAMANSLSLRARIAACAATQDLGGFPAGPWVDGNILTIAAIARDDDGTSTWAKEWDAAPLYNPDGSRTDTGARGDVISDAMILAAVQAVIAAQTAPPSA